MGLPLWQPPVESDVPARPETKDRTAQARSHIRRQARDRAAPANRDRASIASPRDGGMRSRERRRGLLQEMHERMVESNTGVARATINASHTDHDVMEPSRLSRLPLEDRRARLEQHRLELVELMLQNRVRHGPPDGPEPAAPTTTEAAGGQRTGQDSMAHIDRILAHMTDGPADQSDELLEEGHESTATRESLINGLSTTESIAPQTAERYRRATERFARARAALDQSRRETVNRMAVAARIQRRLPLAENDEDEHLEEDTTMEGRVLGRAGAAPTNASARLDGLGDRTRSLSPEGDDAWETLLTTVTPDPQPPSVNSSFASSFTPSAVPRSLANGSSNTSFSSSNHNRQVYGLDLPCDSDDEEEDMDDDSNVRRSYADAVRLTEEARIRNLRRTAALHALSRRRDESSIQSALPRTSRATEARDRDLSDDDILQLVGGLGGMQRIMRSLAGREDIPNDWWVDAGLSRTLPRDGMEDNEA